MLTTKQRKARRTGIGGSDTPAVLGASRWRTPLDVWLDKTGDVSVPVEEVTEGPLYIGSMLEPFLRAEYERQKHCKVVVPKSTLRSAKYPWLIGNVDGLIPGVDAGWEGKVTGTLTDEWGEEGTDQVPQEYLLQCQHYMLVTGLSSWDLTALFGNREIRTYTIVAMPELHRVIVERTKKFWDEHVVAKVPPEWSGERGARLLYTQTDMTETEADVATMEKVEELAHLKLKMKELATRESELIGGIMSYMGPAAVLKYGDETLATWKPRKQSRVDLEALRSKYPEAAAKCTVKSESRVFLLK